MSPTPVPAAAAEVAPTAALRRRRRVRRTPLIVAAVAVLALAGCSVPSNAPTAYGDAVKTNFVQGCVGDIPQTGGTTTTLAPADFCACAYDVFVAQVPFDDDARGSFPNYPADAPTFTSFNDELARADNPQSVWETLPQSVRTDLNTCPLPPGPVAPDTGAAPTDTTTTIAAGG